MAISFEESLKKAKEAALKSYRTATVQTEEVEEMPIMTFAATRAIDTWNIDSKYLWYDEFSDDLISTIDSGKNITLADNQINLTQESNSQYIPFEMPRRYDGFDLASTTLVVFFVNKKGYADFAAPINVKYNDEKIRFGWLVDKRATAVDGILQFEIQAIGTTSKGDEYVWKTKPSNAITILKSLAGNGVIEPDYTWTSGFITEITAQVDEAKKAAQQAQDAVGDIEDYVEEAKASVDEARSVIDGAKAELEAAVSADVDEKVGIALANYYTSDKVDELIANIDISDQLDSVKEDLQEQIDSLDGLAAFDVEYNGSVMTFYNGKDAETRTVMKEISINSDPTDEWTAAYTSSIEQKIADGGNAVKNELTPKITAQETALQEYKATITASVDINSESIRAINKEIEAITEVIDGIDKSPSLYYRATYGAIETSDGSTKENMFTLWQSEGDPDDDSVEKIAVSQFEIVGGSGTGGGTSNKLYIYYDKDTGGNNINKYVFRTEEVSESNAKIYYEFIGEDPAGDSVSYGDATWQIRKGTSGAWTTIATETIYPSGDTPNQFNVSKYITTVGEYTIRLTVTDSTAALASKSWTVQNVDIGLKSNFNDTNVYSGDVSFSYTPYGLLDKEIHFVLDGVEIHTENISRSGVPMSHVIPAQSHGAHLLEVYLTAEINGKKIGVEEIIDENSGEVTGYNYNIKVVKDILWNDGVSTVPMIGCVDTIINAVQYNTVNIKYAVFDPSTETPEVEWYLDGNLVSTEKLSEKGEDGYYTYSYKAYTAGTYIFTIKCGEATPKTITLTVDELDLNIAPVTTGLEFDFNPVGYTNSSENRLWAHGDVTMTVSDNFDWVNGGYQQDENGDWCFCVKAGTNAVINYNLFADDPKKNGKEFKLIFRTRNIRKRDTSFLTCLDYNEQLGTQIGLDMKVENATLYESTGSLRSDYCEDTIIEYEFNIHKNTDMTIVMSYEDGTPSKPYKYTELSSFKQSSVKPITIGSDDCDIHIYRMKAYSNSLTDADILNNFIADARNADEIIARYNRNQIYNENGILIDTATDGGFSVENLMKTAPDLRYIFLEVPQFTNDKDNKIDGCTVYFRYPAGTRDQDNWTCTGMRHRGQGTSSNTYGYAGRNIDLCMDRKTSLFTWTDQEGNIVESSTITLSDTSVPTDYLNIKVNIASSENTNNAEIARRFNEYQPFLRYARKKDSRVKDTMEFYNCVVFIRETSEDASVPHREFSDTNWHFYAIGNIGDSKKTDDTRVNDKDDPKEHVIEIADADKPLSAFPTGKDGHVICPPDEWHAGNSAYDALYADLLFELNEDGELEFSSFGEETYEFRYEKDGITDEEREANIAIWRDLYRFIVTSTDKEFYEHLKDYFVVDSALYYYLFTERYTMVDNRAKNSFWHYGKVYISTSEAAEIGETEASYYIIDDGAAAIHDGYRYDLTFGYDFDTALGIDNTGDYVFSYGKEDTDYYDGDTTKPVFRVHDSVFFCRLRDLFQPEMSAMFRNREEKNAWAASALIAQWDNAQALFPEELWRLDYERKYYRTYLGLSIDGSIVPGGDDQKNEGFLIGKFFGRKKYSRRAFETNQEIYYASKYFGNAVLSSLITIRGNIYSGDNVDLKQNYSLTLVPYSDMYVCVQYTSTGTPIHQKAKAGETVFFENNAETMDFIYIFAAGWIQEIGDLSRCYIDDNNFAAGTRLQKIVIGSADEGYDNPYMKQLSVGSNKLLEYIDLRNISGINTVIDVSGCSNLKKLLAKGTNASGVVFANGGAIQTAELPAITALSARNLFDLTTLDIESCHKLTTLTIENCPKIDIVTIIDQAPNINDVRVTGIDWYLTDTSLLERLYEIYKIDSENAYLAGSVYVPTIKEKQYYDYTQAWDLLITYDKDGWIRQYLVSYVNHDESLLYSLYVDEGGYAYDPVDNGDIDAPTKVSSVSTDYTYSGWNTSFPLQIWGPVTIQAIYAESVRKYTIRYVNPLYVPELVLQETEGDYGTLVPYAGETPTYDLKEGENGWSYSLFEKWDKPGLILGDTTVTADFKTFRYTAGVFDGKELKDLTPVQLYALSKLVEPIDKSFTDYGIDIETGDDYSFTMGYDIDYDDDTIVSEEFVSQKTVFNGSSDYIDTGVKLFDEDKDFVLALDYKMLSGNALSATLMQCYQTSGTQGFQLNYKNTPSFIWGGVSMSEDGTTVSPSAIDAREMLVLRHKKGDNNLYLYTSNLSGDTIKTYVIPRDVVTVSETATLILGAAKAENGSIRNHAKGEINWCKLWFIDLGDDICRKLAEWTHEKITLEVSGFNRYQLHDDTTKESVMSLLATHLLDVKKPYNISNNNNTGGWADCELNRYLNNRFYNAIPYQIKALMKNVSVKSTIGNNQAATKSSGSFVVVPALYDVYDDASDTYREELYEFANTIDYFTGLSNDQEQTNRIRRLADADPESEGTQYWLRSPSIVTWSTNRYCYSIDEKGEPDQITGTSTEHGILIEISI